MHVSLKRFFCCFILLLSTYVLSADKQVEVTNFFAKLYLAPSINSKLMGLAQKGERYSVLMISNYWYRVDFKGVPVWVESANVKVVDPNAPQQPATKETPAVAATQPTAATTDTQQTTSGTIQSQSQRGSPAQAPQSTEVLSDAEIRKARMQDSIIQSSREKRSQSRLSFSRSPVIEQNVEEERIDKFFLVNMPSAKILVSITPDSPILGFVNKGARLQLIGEGDSWCKVAYKDTVGWVEKINGKVISSGAESFFVDYGNLLIIAGITISAILLFIVLVLLFKRLFKKKNILKEEIADNKRVLIIAKEIKSITSALTSTMTTIDRCFLEIGFSTKITADLDNLSATIDSYNPDVLLIDWRFDKMIVNSIERVFASSEKASSVIIITYNVPDPSSMFANPALPHMAFLGISFTDRDLFRIVTPIMLAISSDVSSSQTKSSEPDAALEGEIAGGNLSEVMQFIEAGRKTGCLLVDTGTPFCLIYFNEGRIIYAATADGQIGREALYAALSLKEGTFRFMLNKKPKSSNTNLSTLEVLMSWTKNLDEAFRHGLWTS